MEILSLESITIAPDRQRRVFNPDSLGKLAESIQSKGLFHAPIIRSDSNQLVAGERRLKAITLMHTMSQTFQYNGEDIPAGMVPCVRLSELSEDDIFEAELEENIRRDNLSPQEEMIAMAKLHQFRVKQDPKHSIEQTANEVYDVPDVKGGGRTTAIRDALLVTEHLNDPAVAKAKTKNEAVKAVHKKIQREHAQNLARNFADETQNSTPHIAVLGDAVETLKKMPAGIVDVICSDPPYGIDAHKFGDMADNAHKYDDSYETWLVLMSEVAVESYRVCKAHAHLYMFCDWRRYLKLSSLLSTAGFNVWPRPLIWSKGNGMLAKPEFGPRYTYEVILYASKGNKKVTGVFPDVLNHKAVQVPRHAAEKPVDVYVDLLSRSALPGDHVLDMFMGSGVIFPAANQLKLRATGIEGDETSYGFAIQRLEEK